MRTKWCSDCLTMNGHMANCPNYDDDDFMEPDEDYEYEQARDREDDQDA